MQEMSAAYLRYLTLPLKALRIIYPPDAYKEMLIQEKRKIFRHLNGGGYMKLMTEVPLNPNETPILNNQRYPQIFRDSKRMSFVSEIARAKQERVQQFWAENNYDLIMGIELAQCKAIHEYMKRIDAEILNEAPINRKDILLPIDEIRNDDKRIKIDLDKREALLSDLFKLNTEIKGKEALSEADILYWAQADFSGFKQATKEKKINPGVNKGTLIYFVFQLFIKYSTRSMKSKKQYRDMLLRRMNLFSKTDAHVKYLNSHFADPMPSTFPDGLIIK
jgi:hypothetical protein